MAETLSADEIDQLLAGIDTAMAADRQIKGKPCEIDVKFKYDEKELEKITNLLNELNKILPEIITEKFLNKVSKLWLKKYLKIHLGKMKAVKDGEAGKLSLEQVEKFIMDVTTDGEEEQ